REPDQARKEKTMFVMLAEELGESEGAAIIGSELLSGRVPFIPKWNCHPVGPHDMEGDQGRKKTEREKQERPDPDRHVAPLLHRAAIIGDWFGEPRPGPRRRQVGRSGRSLTFTVIFLPRATTC